MKFEKIGIVGFGQMGSGIAQVAAMSGLDVVMNDLITIFTDNRPKVFRSVRAVSPARRLKKTRGMAAMRRRRMKRSPRGSRPRA